MKPSPKSRRTALGPQDAASRTIAIVQAVIPPLVIILASLAAYANSFRCPFIFDDATSITDNEMVHSFQPLAIIFARPHAMRPVVDLTLAANWSLSRANATGYHVLNFAIHVLAALVLYGVVRRTLLAPRLASPAGPGAAAGGGPLARHAPWLALAVAMLWALHPLQTESVTYIIQRAESIMGLFYLLTVYCAARRLSGGPRWWTAAAMAACILGMGSKQVMVTAPLLVLLYDRTFFAGTFRQALRRSPGLYAGLAASWLVLAALVATASTGPTAGFGMTFYSPWKYAVLQIGVVAHYLRLAVWPYPLCLDYGNAPETWSIILPAIVMAALLGATLWAVIHRPAWGFLGAWVFIVLAPTSSIMPIKDLAFEHRMYLSLAGVAALAVVGAYVLAVRWGRTAPSRQAILASLSAACAITVVALGMGTCIRNADYRDTVAVWENIVSNSPNNVRALNNLAQELGKKYAGPGKTPTPAQAEEIRTSLEKALAIDPNYWLALNNMGSLLMSLDQTEDAIVEFRKGVAANKDFTTCWCNLGTALEKVGQDEEALDAFKKAAEIDPRNAWFQYQLANQLKKMKRYDQALAPYQEALRRNEAASGADYVDAATMIHRALADLYYRMGKSAQAVEHYGAALKIKPGNPQATTGLAWVLATSDDDSIRNGRKAQQLAASACMALQGPDSKEKAAAFDALAAAQAEDKLFALAAQTAQRAHDIAAAAGEKELAGEIASRISLYQAAQAYRRATSRTSGS